MKVSLLLATVLLGGCLIAQADVGDGKQAPPPPSPPPSYTYPQPQQPPPAYYCLTAFCLLLWGAGVYRGIFPAFLWPLLPGTGLFRWLPGILSPGLFSRLPGRRLLSTLGLIAVPAGNRRGSFSSFVRSEGRDDREMVDLL